jgi:hypothetical protein
MKEPDIYSRPAYLDENPMDSIMDKFSVLSLKDPENLKKEVINLNIKESRNYILDLEYRNYINNILDKNNKKLGLIVIALELCEIMITIPNIVKNLQELELYQLENSKLNREYLEKFKFTGLEKLTNIKPLEKFINLQILKLKNLENLSDITPIEKLVNLQSLDLFHLQKLEDITPLIKLKKLKNLRIYGYRQDHIRVIENLKLDKIESIQEKIEQISI